MEEDEKAHEIPPILSLLLIQETFEMFEMRSIYFDRDEDAICFKLIVDNHLYSFRYSLNKNSGGELGGANIKKINDRWLLIADE